MAKETLREQSLYLEERLASDFRSSRDALAKYAFFKVGKGLGYEVGKAIASGSFFMKNKAVVPLLAGLGTRFLPVVIRWLKRM